MEISNEEVEVEVQVVSRTLVCPPLSQPPLAMYLSGIDAMWQDFHYNRRVLFYPAAINPTGHHSSTTIDLLKSSLLRALPLFYPWIGRLSLTNDAGIGVVDGGTGDGDDDDVRDAIIDDGGDNGDAHHDIDNDVDGTVHRDNTRVCGGVGTNPHANGNANSHANIANGVHPTIGVEPNGKIEVKSNSEVKPNPGSKAEAQVNPAVSLSGRLVIEFDKKKELGVEFIEAYVDLPYSELLEDGFQLRPFFDKLCKYSHHERSEIYDLPLLSVQVTKFKDGGMALAYAQSHVVADGHSMWHFMKAWSECARGLEISMPPLHQREFFKIDKPSEELTNLVTNNLLGNTDDEVDGNNPSGKGGPPPPMVLTPRLFQFTREMVLRLKELASQGGRYGPFTSYEVLVSHFWRHVTKARALKGGRYVHIMVIANCRKRVTPPLPLSYFGNCINSAVAQTTAGEILTEDLATTALRIRSAAAQAASGSSLLEFNHWLELNGNSVFGSKWPNSKGMIVASSHFFPCYEIDFGITGCPDAIRTTLVKDDGEMVLFPGKNGNGSIDVCMPLQPCAMDRLLQDPHFLNF